MTHDREQAQYTRARGGERFGAHRYGVYFTRDKEQKTITTDAHKGGHGGR